MGYRIEYDGRAGKYEVKPEGKGFAKILLFFVILFAALTLWPNGAQKLRSFLIPGDDTVTVQAFRNMTDDLRSGAAVGEAVEAFCRYVIHGQ